MKPPWGGYESLGDLAYMTKMAATPIYGMVTLQKSSPEEVKIIIMFFFSKTMQSMISKLVGPFN